MATRRLRVGSGVCLIIERDPITTAKQVASIDQLSGGRVEFGIGAGWNLEEMANHGTDPRERFAVFGERIEAMKSMWTEDEATYHGQHVNFERIWIWPKPTQRPYPPILVGGHGKRVLERVHSYGDGWMATHRAGAIDRINELRAGDTDRRMTVTVSGVPADPRVLDMYAAAGVDRVNFWVPSAPRGPVERALDEYERAIAEHRGE
jgi:probable F420-dependent oxidoreductase